MSEFSPPPTRSRQPPCFAGALCAASIFVSAFLLFQVQPLISKMILPWFGGSPAVWTTCMLFFQAFLLAGYAYANRLESLRQPRHRAVCHITMLILACCTLPITRAEAMRPADSTEPISKILLLLLFSVGLPYLVLASTGPLVQSWFARIYPQRSPYRLYALSNLGSLIALLSYPVLVEPNFAVRTQGRAWSLGFIVFACMTVGVAMVQAKVAKQQASSDTESPREFISLARRLAYWFALPALASVMLLAVTNQLCQNVAVIPMLWIAPLSVYLLSFIICFDRPEWYSRRWFAAGTAIAIVLISKLLLAGVIADSKWYYEPEYIRKLEGNQLIHIGLYLFGLFSICMLCHGETVRSKPSAQHLTSFYLWIAAGGASGGLIVSLLCPSVFSTYVELNFGLLFSFLIAISLFYRDVRARWLTKPITHFAFLFVSGLALVTVLAAQINSLTSDHLVDRRNFYGVLSVSTETFDEEMKNANLMYSGAKTHGGITLHGKQYTHPELRREPTLYYTRSSGVGLTFDHFPQQDQRHVGLIGLGVGTVATYGRPGDILQFYEINPLVYELAEEHFSYLQDCQAEQSVLLGDGRALLEQQPAQSFDILVVDAFSGDTIPTHLLTTEAFSLYLEKHLHPEGVLAIHVSNRHMNLLPIVAAQAKQLDWPCVYVKNSPESLRAYASTWVLLTRNTPFLNVPTIAKAAQRFPADIVLDEPWTDQKNTVLQLLIRGRDYLKDELKNAPRLAESQSAPADSD